MAFFLYAPPAVLAPPACSVKAMLNDFPKLIPFGAIVPPDVASIAVVFKLPAEVSTYESIGIKPLAYDIPVTPSSGERSVFTDCCNCVLNKSVAVCNNGNPKVIPFPNVCTTFVPPDVVSIFSVFCFTVSVI